MFGTLRIRDLFRHLQSPRILQEIMYTCVSSLLRLVCKFNGCRVGPRGAQWDGVFAVYSPITEVIALHSVVRSGVNNAEKLIPARDLSRRNSSGNAI